MTHEKREFAHMKFVSGLVIGIVTAVVLHSIPVGVGVGLVFALSLKQDDARDTKQVEAT